MADASPAVGPAPAGWVLTLALHAPGQLLAVLGDGLWHGQAATSAWPPTGRHALPPALLPTLSRLQGAALNLQLPPALDAWPWERELAEAAGLSQRVPRFLTGLPEDGDDTPAPALQASLQLPLLVPRSALVDPLALVQAARRQHRPLVLTEATLSVARRLALERSLRSHWRGPLLLSDALARVLQRVDLPPDCCQLYGNGRAQAVDDEQGLRPVTALSVDLVGSTSLMQTLGSEAYARRLQAHYRQCRDVILRFEGSVDAPQGNDGLMAYFGFPAAVEGAAARALAAAWALSHGVASTGLQVRIGVASGQLAVSAQQAFGPEVHLAARLCAAARPGQILVAPSTLERVGPGVPLAVPDELPPLKDFAGLTGIRVLCGPPDPATEWRTPTGSAAAFVGRQRELSALREAWSTACAGRDRWCVVQGEAGIGKSRLLLEFAQGLRAGGARCLEWTGQLQQASSPFAAVVDALRRHWAIDARMDGRALQRCLVQALPARLHDDLTDLARLLSQAVPEPAADRGADGTTQAAGERRAAGGAARRWSDLLLDCLLALAESGPLCLLVDDAHWLDPSSMALLRRLRDAAAGRALLVVLGERTESGRAASLADAAPLELQRLSDAHARELADLLGSALPERLRRQVVERAEGVPLYLEESLRMLARRDADALGDIPATLQDLLMVRLDELGPDRTLAQLLSVLGRDCSAAHVQDLLAQRDPFVERACQQGSLGSLLASGLLQPLDGPAPGYRFKHALIRDAAYRSIWSDDRVRLHGLCADLIERGSPELLQQRPEQLAHHLEAAGRALPALRAWCAAAQLSATRHAHHETLALAQRALALRDRVPDDDERAHASLQLHLLQASAQIALQGYGSAEVEAAYQAAERAGQRLAGSSHALRTRLGLEACYVMRGDLARAAGLAQDCVAQTEWSRDPRLALQSRWALANVKFHQGDWPSALAGFDDCLAHYRRDLHRRSGVQDPAVMCLGYSSWIHFELGQADEALDRIDRLLALTDELQHPFSTGVALGFAASLKRLCGDPDGAWPHAQEAARICERGGFQVWLAHAWMVRGQLRADRGDLAGGDADMDRGYALWVGGGARISCATYLVTRAELLLRQARTGEAVAALDEAWSISEAICEHYYQAELLRLRGLCHWQAGDGAQAEAVLAQALDLSRRQRKPGLSLRVALSMGALEAASGRHRDAVQRLRTLVDDLPGHGRCRDSRWAAQALARWNAGRCAEAQDATPWEPR